MENIRIILVDDHEIVRTGLKSYLETQPGLQVVGEAEDGETALRVAEQTRPDVVVMDITMPGMDGMQAAQRMKETSPESKVLALTIHADKQYFFQMLAAGATGYLTKQAAAEELVIAIRSVAQGNVYLQPALARWLLEDYQRLVAKSPPEGLPTNAMPGSKGLQVLSKRERQVLEAVAQGHTNPEIGGALGISPKTVARHRERIMNKLDLHSSAELIKFAIRTGLITIQ